MRMTLFHFFIFLGSDPTTMQLLQQQQLMQNINTDPMSSILAQQMAQLQMQQQLTFQQPLTYPSVSVRVESSIEKSCKP